MADGSIQKAPHRWSSGSARSRLYMKPWSCTGFTSARPPCVAAARFIASTASRLSSASESIRPLEPVGGSGRSVNVRHLACVSSITQIEPLHAMQAAVSSLKRRSCRKPSAS